MTFDNNNGAPGATEAQLVNLGQGLFTTPTVGTSTDAIFETDEVGDFAANDPVGGFFNFGGTPVANFG